MLQQLTMRLPQDTPPPLPLSPVLYNAYVRGVTDVNSDGLRRVPTLAGDELIYRTASDIP